MSEKRLEIAHHIPIFGIFLLFLGVVFLLQTLNVIPWGLWGILWHFWPVLIIIIGLGILLRRYNPWLVSVLVLAVLFACLGIAIWQYEPSLPAGQTTQSYSEPLGNLECAGIEVNFTAGSLTVSSLSPGSLNFVEAEVRVSDGDGDRGMRADFHQQDGEGRLRLSTEQVDRQFRGEAGLRWEVRFTRNIPLTIEVESAASNLNLDLGKLEVSELRIDIDASNCRVQMPDLIGTTYAYIEADVANVEVTIPDGVAGRLKVDVDLGAFEVDENRFPKKGGYYISPDFESAQNRIELELDCDLGRVQIK